MEFYYTPSENVSSDTLEIKGEEAKHLSKVLRKSSGEEIFVTDGNYNLFRTQIISVSKNSVECKILEKAKENNEPGIKIFLYQSLLKNPSRFEFAIEKSVELGVFEIISLITEHVINKSSSRLERWQSIALSAMKQSQRTYLPKIQAPILFEDAVKQADKNSLNLIAHEQHNAEQIGINVITSPGRNVNVFIGPEGGFSEKEIEAAKEAGFKILNLGKRKYRSETAGMFTTGFLSSLSK